MRTRRSWLLGGVLACFMFIAWSSSYAGGKQEWAQVTKKLPKRYAGTEINVIWCSGRHWDAMAKLSQEFMEATGIKVTHTGLSAMDVHTKIMLDFMSGSGGIDVVGVSHIWKAEVDPYMADLNELAKQVPDAPSLELDDWSPRGLGIYGKYKGRLMALPLRGDVTLLVWNKDFYEEVGLHPDQGPRTWDELYEWGKLLTKAPTRYGFGLPAGKDSQTTCLYLMLFKAFGGEYFDPDMKPLLDSDAGMKTMKFMVEKLKGISPPGIITWGFSDVINAFCARETAQTYMWPGAMGTISDPKQSRVAGRFGWSPSPEKPLVGGWGIGVNKDSANKEAAYLYVVWFASPEIRKRVALIGGAPLRISVLTDPELVAKIPYFPAYQAAYEQAIEWPAIKEMDQLDVLIANEVNAMVSGVKSPEQAAHDLQEKTFDLMKRYGYYKK